MDEAEIIRQFTYHAPDPDQINKLSLLRNQAKDLAYMILNVVPDCADRTAAIRKLRECVMTANAAIMIPRD